MTPPTNGAIKEKNKGPIVSKRMAVVWQCVTINTTTILALFTVNTQA